MFNVRLSEAKNRVFEFNYEIIFDSVTETFCPEFVKWDFMHCIYVCRLPEVLSNLQRKVILMKYYHSKRSQDRGNKKPSNFEMHTTLLVLTQRIISVFTLLIANSLQWGWKHFCNLAYLLCAFSCHLRISTVWKRWVVTVRHKPYWRYENASV